MKTEQAVTRTVQAELDFSKAAGAAEPTEIIIRNELRENRIGRCGRNCANCACRRLCGHTRVNA